MIASLPAGSQPPQRPSAESASPSSWSAPVTATIAASPTMVATAPPQSGSAAALNATPTPATTSPASGNHTEARRSSPAPSEPPPAGASAPVASAEGAAAHGTRRRVRKATATQSPRNGASMAPAGYSPGRRRIPVGVLGPRQGSRLGTRWGGSGGSCLGLPPDLHDYLDLDGDAEGQGGDADGGAALPLGVPVEVEVIVEIGGEPEGQ